MKILIIRFSSLGDIIMATAMIRCLRLAYPKAQIDMIVRADFLDLIRYNPHLNRKIAFGRDQGFKGLRRLIREINQEKYDLIYDAHRSLRTWLMMPFLKAKAKAYFEKPYLRRALALTFKLPILDQKRMLERYIDPLRPFGVSYDKLGPEMFLDEASKAQAMAKVPLPKSHLVVGVVPSAQWPGKRWPLKYFRVLMERLVLETNVTLVVFGGPEDTFCGELCESFAKDRVVNSQGKLSIAESAALLKLCNLVVANDTGLMHVADALGVPCVLFLGPTSAEMGCLPFHPNTLVLEEKLWCRPCSKNGQAPCIRRERYCLTRLSPERALAATLKIAAESGA